jgi:hypothetical protein
MILEISKTNVLWMPITFYTVKGNDDVIEKIILDGKELNLHSETDLLKAIDALNESKKCAMFSADETNCMNDLFGVNFGVNVSALSEKFNAITENLINTIENMRASIKTPNNCDGCALIDLCSSNNTVNVIEPDCDLGICPENGCADCTFDDEDYVETEAEYEARKASDAVEAVSNTRTFHWAQKYMDSVIDPASELSGPEYNTLLAMFTQYGEWILKQ